MGFEVCILVALEGSSWIFASHDKEKAEKEYNQQFLSCRPLESSASLPSSCVSANCVCYDEPQCDAESGFDLIACAEIAG